VEVRVGIDTSKDGKADTWSKWAEVKEKYDHIPGFSKQIERIPASLDLKNLPKGHGLGFEIRLTDTTENSSKPMIEQLEIRFTL